MRSSILRDIVFTETLFTIHDKRGVLSVGMTLTAAESLQQLLISELALGNTKKGNLRTRLQYFQLGRLLIMLRQIIVKVRNTLFKGSANKRQITILTNLFVI